MSPLPRGIARVNRIALNRVMRVLAPRAPGFALVRHRGRRTGTEHTTPVNIFRSGAGYRIALTYGTETDWVRNVLAAGGCTVIIRGRTVELVEPRLIHDADRSWAPPVVRQILGILHVPDSMVLDVRR
ncbi:nitroreductase family deazaflavin-dependent oxidoreductase [Georgenia subflava]|nr:nitroreductase family deazaflavin-dependent oxidoreductase [Georgenia subflava]